MSVTSKPNSVLAPAEETESRVYTFIHIHYNLIGFAAALGRQQLRLESFHRLDRCCRRDGPMRIREVTFIAHALMSRRLPPDVSHPTKAQAIAGSRRIGD